MQSVIAFLVNDRCDGHPELSNLAAADAAACCAAASVEIRRARRKEGHRQASSNLDVREKLTDLTLKNC